MNDQKNLLYFIIIFMAVMAGWYYFYETPKLKQVTEQPAQQSQVQKDTASVAPVQPTLPQKQEPAANREAAISETKRVTVNTPSIKGSINLTGALIDDVVLKKYHKTTNPKSENIVLFEPQQAPHPYFAEFGWTAVGESLNLPNNSSVWEADKEELTPNSGPVTLKWDNGQGLQFIKKISVDQDYLFTIEQSVVNNSKAQIRLFSYAKIRREGTPPVQGYMILHEGPIGYIGDKLKEYDYTDLQKKQEIRENSTGGWIGITDKYWLSALIPDQKNKEEFYFSDQKAGSQNNYVTGYFGEPTLIEPGHSAQTTTHLFAGAKVLSILDGYEEKLGVKHFDLAVDFGWFYFITKPLFYLLEILYDWLGNFGLAIMALTVLIKILFFPLANKSYRSMARMKALQPKIESLKERFKDDKMRLNQEMMNLYKKEKVNPAAGCLPLIIQIPVFFALYKVFFVTIEMRQAPFYGWITDLSAPDPTSVFNLFGLIPWHLPEMLHIGILPILMGLSMWVQQKLNPAPADPIQQKMFLVMPIVLTVMLAQFPAGLVLYWTWNNILSIAQQWIIMKTAKVPARTK